MEKIKVADLMTRNPITVTPSTNLLDCAKKMIRKKVGSLILVDKENNFKGIISEKDILWAIIKKSKKNLSEINAEDLSPKKIQKINSSLPLIEVIKKIKKSKFERFPVVHEGKLVGLITTRDILNFNPEIYPEIGEFSKIREESKKLKRIEKVKEGETIKEGVCDVCGRKDLLYRSGEKQVCEKCKNSI